MTKARDIASANPAPTTVSTTELGYVDGVTSAIQTQMDAKLATATAASTYLPSATAATTYVANSLADAKGDIFAATADNTVTRLAVGANNTILTADSTAATGLKWAAAAPSGAFTLLSTTNITAAATISVTSINQTYKHLFVTVNNFRPLANNDIQLYLETSGAANINIGQTEVAFNGTNPLASANLTGNSQGFLAKDVNSTSGVGTNSSSFWVYNYASTSLQKSITGSYGVYGVTNGNYRFATFGGSTFSATGLGAVSTLKITTPSSTFAAQGTIQIYGVN